MNYAVFLKHQKTGDTAIVRSPGLSSQDALARVTPALGEGWMATGAMERKPQSEAVGPEQNKFRVVAFGEGPTAKMLNEPFGPWDIMKKLAPQYVVFDLDQLWSFDYGGTAPGHFMYLWKEMVMNDKGDWAYMSWEYNVGLERALQKPLENKHGHLVYAIYEKVRGHEYSAGPLYKLVATRDV